jgi:predicted nucleic acid-binding protein
MFPAFLDTNVLYSAVLTDTLLRIADERVYEPRWSPDVLAELERNLSSKTSMSSQQVAHRLEQMGRAFPYASVTGYEGLIDGLMCDPKDRHVLAATIRGGCQVLVTFNTRDFPDDSVAEHGIAVVHPEDFILDQLDLYPSQVRSALWAQASASSRPSLSYAELLARLRRAGVGAFVDELRQRFGEDAEITGGEGKRFAPK